MADFFRLNERGLINLGEVPKLGFPTEDPSFIPDDYIEKGEFLIMRLCNGLGDWGIISAMPRLLKQKYPHCKVYVPSIKLIQKIFGDSTPWKHWPEPEKNCEKIFINNPYVDGFVNDINDEVFHDHYRLYDPNNVNVSLVKQMMLFWGFDESECKDYEPELYFSNSEIEEGNKIIKHYIKDEDFGGFICTSSQLKKGEFFNDKTDILINELNKHKLKYVYYGGVDIKDTPFNNVNVVLDFNKVKTDLRIQLYIRSKASVNIGYQSSIFELICRYSQIICTEMLGGVRENYFETIKYLK
tara:strand:- start:2526 stop:3419 length:894 start_codon:yes stop_codon:yes gene_type:complete